MVHYQVHRRFNSGSTLALILLGLVFLSSCTAVTPTSSETPEDPASPTPKPAATSGPTPGSTPVQDSRPTPAPPWFAAPPMLHARAAHAVVSSTDAIYALAGTDESGQPVQAVERFDGGAWTLETSLPGGPLNAPAAVWLDGRLYLIGGFEGGSNLPTAEVYAYDPASKMWMALASLPAPRGGHAAVVIKGRIHVVGGGNNYTTLADHSVYDPSSNTWADLAPLPRSQGSPAAVDMDGTLVVIGGRSGSSDFGDVYFYDTASDSWSNGPSIVPRGGAGAVYVCGRIYLLGGESQAERRTLDEALRFDPVTLLWESIEPMPGARTNGRAVIFNGDVYVVGGATHPVRSHAPEGITTVERLEINCGP